MTQSAATNDLKGRTYAITGANSGIGRVTAHTLAARGARVLLLCRSAEKTAPVIDEIKRTTGNDAVELVALDLADLASVRDCARGLIARGIKLDGLINNAGLAGKKGVTQQGFELTFGTNHLGHFLLTSLLLDRIVSSQPGAPARIVNVASKGHYSTEAIDWDAQRQRTKTVTGLREYCVSKLCNVIFTKELARRLDRARVTTYSLHPGVVATDVWRQIPRPLAWVARQFMTEIEDGAQTTLYCATSPEVADHTGRYYDDLRERRPSRLAEDPELAAELWKRSEEWTADFR